MDREPDPAGPFVTDNRWLWPLVNLGLLAACIIRDTYHWWEAHRDRCAHH